VTDSKNVLLIHGTWQTAEFWAEAIPEFETRGFTVHAPNLRHHELPLDEGVQQIATLSLDDYTEDLVNLARSLDSPPLIVGHSLGGLLAMKVASQVPHVGVVAACSAPGAGTFTFYPGAAKTFAPHFFQLRPWAKPVMPKWENYRFAGASRQPEAEARERFDGLVAESGRVYCELGFPWFDRKNAAKVDSDSITAPVLAIAAEHDNVIHARIPREIAKRFRRGSHTVVSDSDHMLFFGVALPRAMAAIDQWLNDEKIYEET